METWEIGDTRAEVTGRERKSLLLKINPIWWLLNDDEQQLPAWYRPDWSHARRYFYWNFLRNPLQNFRCYVIGVADRPYTVTGKAPVLTVQRDDLDPPEFGWQWSAIKLGWLRLPFVSYSGPRLVCYAGWQPTGIFGSKIAWRFWRLT